MPAGDHARASLAQSFFARCRTHAALLIASLLTTAALAACSSNSEDEATPTTTTPSPVVATPSPTPSPTPTAEPFKLEDIPVPPDPMIPQAMLTIDEEGARAFVVHALTELFWMLATGNSDEWLGISDTGCDYCTVQVERMNGSNRRHTGLHPVLTGGEIMQDPEGRTLWLVGVDFRLPKHKIWDLTTMTVQTIDESKESESLWFMVGHDGEIWGILDVATSRPSNVLEGEKS